MACSVDGRWTLYFFSVLPKDVIVAVRTSKIIFCWPTKHVTICQKIVYGWHHGGRHPKSLSGRCIISQRTVFPQIFQLVHKGSQVILISLDGALGPGISGGIMKNNYFRPILGGRLYDITMMGHMLYVVFIYPNGLNPSVANPRLTFWGLIVKFGCCLWKSCQSKPSVECFKKPLFLSFWALCHFICLAILFDMNSLYNLGINRSQRNTLCGIFLPLLRL